MNVTTTKKNTNFKKSIISIVIISTITGGLVLLENYRQEKAASQFSTQLSHINAPIRPYNEQIVQTNYHEESLQNSLVTTDASALAVIAENHLQVEEPIEFTEVSQEQIMGESSLQTATESTDSHIQLDVLFALSSSTISPEYKLALIKVASQIKAQSDDKKWQVIGHTDKSGRAIYNLKLAQKRAQQVIDFLTEQGVHSSQLTLVTLGEYEATNLDNSTYNKNLRRVEIIEFEPKVSALAMQLQQRYEKIEKQRIRHKLINMAAKDKAEALKAEAALMADKQEKEAIIKHFSLETKKTNNTDVAFDANNPQTREENKEPIVITEPLANNTTYRTNSVTRTQPYTF